VDGVGCTSEEPGAAGAAGGISRHRSLRNFGRSTAIQLHSGYSNSFRIWASSNQTEVDRKEVGGYFSKEAKECEQ